MSETDLHILKDKDGSGAGALDPVGVPVSKLRVPVVKQILGYLDNIRYSGC